MAETAEELVPDSWAPRDSWPRAIFPNDRRKGQQLVVTHREALVQANALVRIGRTLVVLKEPYQRWLAQQGARVLSYNIAPNRPENAQRRFGRARADSHA